MASRVDRGIRLMPGEGEVAMPYRCDNRRLLSDRKVGAFPILLYWAIPGVRSRQADDSR